MSKQYTTEERAKLVYERLLMFLQDGLADPDELQEFTKGGISACCMILDIRNPYTGNRFVGDLAEMV